MTDDAWTHAHDEPPARDLVVVPSAEEEPPEGEPQDTRPIVIVHTGDLARDTRALWQGLDESNRPATLFTYGGLMARLRPDPVTHLPSVQPLDKDMVRNEVANRVRCCKLGSDGLLVQVYPSMDLVAQLLASRTMDLPTLERLVPVPVFTEDGRLVQQPGYDEPSGVYYEPEPHLTLRPVPEKPTSRHLAVAKRWIDEIMIDFPFDSEADKAAAVTLLVEPFVRSMIVGPCPLHLFEAPTPRTGKGLLAETLALPFIGPHLTITGWPTDEGEMRKRITSLLLAGATIVLFDNVDRPIASGNLSAALTGEVWSDRVLKVSQMMKAPQRLVWIATANNPVCSSEMAGRIVSCRLDAKMERPGERPTQAFHHPRLKKWARAHRRSLIWSALVLAQHWIAQGRPEPKQVPAMGGFEGWCEVLGGILEAADIGGLL